MFSQDQNIRFFIRFFIYNQDWSGTPQHLYIHMDIT
jgi:hypothetical protein